MERVPSREVAPFANRRAAFGDSWSRGCRYHVIPLAGTQMLLACSHAGIASSLKAHMAASQAFQQLVNVTKESGSRVDAEGAAVAASLLGALLEATADQTGGRGVIAALLHTPGAFPSLLHFIRVRLLVPSVMCI